MKHFLLFYDTVPEYPVREWTTVVGEGAATPVVP